MKHLWALLLLGSCSVEPGTVSDAMPPGRFRGPGMAVVHFVPPDAVPEVCGLEPIEGVRWMGCHFGGTIVLPLPDTYADAGEEYARLVTHELGHLHGWPGDHPE